MKSFLILGIVFRLAHLSVGQRVAPGVPPQHYQQPQMHQGQMQPPVHQQQMYQQQPGQMQQQQQQQQQQQMHHQQVPVQHQQIPVQPQQVPMQHQQQQMPVQHQQPGQVQGEGFQQQQQQQHHGHGQGGVAGGNMLNTAHIQSERQHIAEHFDVPIDTSKMSEKELEFHYFKMHDADDNNKLDGCELIKSLIHWHEQGSKQGPQSGQPHIEEKLFSDNELLSMIDPILKADDANHDGFIDYTEFVTAQQKAATGQQQPHQ